MKKFVVGVVLAVVVSVIHAAEIKGFKPGMKRADVVRALKGLKSERFAGRDFVDGFTVGGVPGTLIIEYDEDEAGQISFIFKTRYFGSVLEAVKGKYPELKCSTGTLSDREVTHCSSDQLNLMLNSDGGGGDGVLILTDGRTDLQRNERQREAAKKDI